MFAIIGRFQNPHSNNITPRKYDLRGYILKICFPQSDVSRIRYLLLSQKASHISL